MHQLGRNYLQMFPSSQRKNRRSGFIIPRNTNFGFTSTRTGCTQEEFQLNSSLSEHLMINIEAQQGNSGISSGSIKVTWVKDEKELLWSR